MTEEKQILVPESLVRFALEAILSGAGYWYKAKEDCINNNTNELLGTLDHYLLDEKMYEKALELEKNDELPSGYYELKQIWEMNND